MDGLEEGSCDSCLSSMNDLVYIAHSLFLLL